MAVVDGLMPEEVPLCCPFCGHTSARVYTVGSMAMTVSGKWHVFCPECHAQGPSVQGKRNAVRHWNNPLGLTLVERNPRNKKERA